MGSRRISDLHPDLQPLALRFITLCEAAGVRVLIICTYRTDDEQDELYAKGRTAPGKIVTNIPGGAGDPHNFSIDGKPAAKAFDSAPLNSRAECNWDASHPDWVKMGEVGEALGLKWGGRWQHLKDMGHFQLPD